MMNSLSERRTATHAVLNEQWRYEPQDNTLGERRRAHPVRGQGRAHLCSKVRTTIPIFFQPELRTRAHRKEIVCPMLSPSPSHPGSPHVRR